MSEILHPEIYKDENIEAYLEVTPHNELFFHCYVHNWSKQVYKDFLVKWVEFLEQIKAKGYTQIYAAAKDEKLIKFASLFGFVLTKDCVKDSEGATRKVLVCLV